MQTQLSFDVVEAKFVKSSKALDQCPAANKPEYAFIGRSNVGKSSLINMLANNKNLAKTSQTPGKTQLINHFIADDKWFIVDLPGYGFAKVSKSDREAWEQMIYEYLSQRENLLCIFVLVDSRLEPQKIDLEFMLWLGESQLPFSIVFTKTDKLSASQLKTNVENYKKVLLEYFEEFPRFFITSSEKKVGNTEILSFIKELNQNFK
ncbi:MAG: ribosome biogenesis GTP-binding protein YihA/YsxC [Raineya sp.]|nr:ribosome biogenesis GTP-binding protein YihA/YsxC [Raineya sp.]